MITIAEGIHDIGKKDLTSRSLHDVPVLLRRDRTGALGLQEGSKHLRTIDYCRLIETEGHLYSQNLTYVRIEIVSHSDIMRGLLPSQKLTSLSRSH